MDRNGKAVLSTAVSIFFKGEADIMHKTYTVYNKKNNINNNPPCSNLHFKFLSWHNCKLKRLSESMKK